MSPAPPLRIVEVSTLRDAARILQISENWLYRYVDLDLPAIRYRDRIYFDPSDVHALAARRAARRQNGVAS